MARVLVSIITKHNVPNFLFFMQMSGSFDSNLFIVTEQVKDKEAQLFSEVIRGKATQSIILDANNYKQNIDTMNAFAEKCPGDTFIVNLTGGTKAMSMAVHDVLVKHGGEFYTVTQDTKAFYNFQTGERTPFSPSVSVSLKDYLKLYGLSTRGQNRQGSKRAKEVFNQVRDSGFDKVNCALVDTAQEQDSAEERKYLSGEWFEDYVYYRLRKDFPEIGDKDITSSVKLYKDDRTSQANNSSEIDVIFVKDNSLYVIECKVGLETDEIRAAMNKAAAISSYVGFKVNFYIFWLRNMRTYKKDVLDSLGERASLIGLRGVVTSNDLKDDDNKAYLTNPEIRGDLQ